MTLIKWKKKTSKLNINYSRSLLYSYNSEMVYTILQSRGKEWYNTVARSSTACYLSRSSRAHYSNTPWEGINEQTNIGLDQFPDAYIKMTLQRTCISGILLHRGMSLLCRAVCRSSLFMLITVFEFGVLVGLFRFWLWPQTLPVIVWW